MQEQPLLETQTTFPQHFPNRRLEQAIIEELPPEAKKRFGIRKPTFIEAVRGINPVKYDQLLKIVHDNGEESYIRTVSNSKSHKVYVAEFNTDKEYIGTGSMKLFTQTDNEFFKDKPYVNWTKTHEEHERRGYGTRRLYIMNALSQTIHQLPLNSSGKFIINYLVDDTPSQKRLWQNLVEAGDATPYKYQNEERFVFNKEINGL